MMSWNAASSPIWTSDLRLLATTPKRSHKPLLSLARMKNSTAQKPKELASNCLVGEPSCDSRCEVSHALSVREVTSAVSIVELSKVTLQVFRADVVVRSIERTLQLTKVVLAKVRTLGLFSRVLTLRVVNDMVTCHLRANGPVHAERVSVQRGLSHVHVRTNVGKQKSPPTLGTAFERTSPVEASMSDTTGILCVRWLCRASRLSACQFLGSPPIHVSSLTTSPENNVKSSWLMASRIRCNMNHALRPATPYLRSTSRAATPFFEEQSSKMTMSQIRSAILVPCIIVLVMTLNCFLQSRQRHTRR